MKYRNRELNAQGRATIEKWFRENRNAPILPGAPNPFGFWVAYANARSEGRELPEDALRYFDRVAERLLTLVHYEQDQARDFAGAVVAALGMSTGRGKGSPASKVREVVRDWEIVEACGDELCRNPALGWETIDARIAREQKLSLETATKYRARALKRLVDAKRPTEVMREVGRIAKEEGISTISLLAPGHTELLRALIIRARYPDAMTPGFVLPERK